MLQTRATGETHVRKQINRHMRNEVVRSPVLGTGSHRAQMCLVYLEVLCFSTQAVRQLDEIGEVIVTYTALACVHAKGHTQELLTARKGSKGRVEDVQAAVREDVG